MMKAILSKERYKNSQTHSLADAIKVSEETVKVSKQ